MKKHVSVIVCILLAASVSAARAEGVPEKNERQPEQKGIDGYTNTPMYPDCKWHIHDPNRPSQRLLTPSMTGSRLNLLTVQRSFSTARILSSL